MTWAVRGLLSEAGLEWEGCVPWGTPPSLRRPGVYVVSTMADPGGAEPPPPFVPACAAVEEWFARRPPVRIDGEPGSPSALVARMTESWVADEHVLYVGLASASVRARVAAYYRTPLGARKPHSGGWFLKTYGDIDAVSVHFAASPDPGSSEFEMLRAFAGSTSPARLPFANLEWPRGRRKSHGITGARAG